MEIRVGCSGWSYQGWVGPFYPVGTRPGDFLRLYSSVFDTVEIDSTFYAIPEENTAKLWRSVTPDNFVFTAKLPREITHDLRLKNSQDTLGRFADVIRKLGSKLALFLCSCHHTLHSSRARIV